ncbi:MAG: barstar family protein [Rhodocyclaceae bacterium]|nr:barstar family protein [Rhodocyclaceae bacterium]
MKEAHILIDGLQFRHPWRFFQHFAERALDGTAWGHNLDAFNDVLRGGFGTPEDSFVIAWLNHTVSGQRLGYANHSPTPVAS